MEKKQLCILLIDDNRDNLTTLRALLAETFVDASVITANTGQSGIEIALLKDPDVIILDIVMPEIDGLETCKWLKANPKTRDIPIIFLTALHGDIRTKVAALDAGGDAFLSKPFDRTELIAQVHAMIKIKDANKNKRYEVLRLLQTIDLQGREFIESYNEKLRLFELLKQEEAKRKTSEEILNEAQALGLIGSFEISAENQRVIPSDTVLQIFGIDKSNFNGELSELLRLVHPNDIDWVEQRIKDSKESGTPVDLIFRILNAKIGERIILLKYKPQNAPHRILSAGIGIIQDITEREMLEDKLVHSEEEFSYIFYNAVEGKSLTSFTGDLRVNNAFCEMLGYSEVELMGKKWQDITHPEDIEESELELELLLSRKKEIVHLEKRYIKKDGSIIWADVNVKVKFDPLGKPDYLITSVVDITDKKETERALVESEQKHRRLVTQMSQGLALHEIIVDANDAPINYRFLDVNDSFERITGLQRKDIIGRTILEVLPETEPIWIETYGHVALTGAPVEFENYSSALQKYFHVSAYCPTPNQFATIFIDVTEQMLIQKELVSSESRFRALSEQSLIGISILDKNRVRIYANAEYAKILGCDIDELIGVDILEGIHPDDIEKVRSAVAAKLNGNVKSTQYRYKRRNKSGEYRDIEVFSTLADLGGEPINISSSIDITDRLRAENALIESEIRYRRLFEAAKDGIVIINTDSGIIEHANPYVCEMLGYPVDQLVGKTLFDLGIVMKYDSVRELIKVLEVNKYFQIDETTFKTDKGNELSIELSFNMYSIGEGRVVQVDFKDITNTKKAVDELRESEELFHSAFDSSVLGICMLNANGRYIRANNKICEMLGYSSEELLTMTFMDVTHHDDIQYGIENLKRFIANEIENMNYDKRYIRKDGSVFWGNITISSIRDKNNRFMYNVNYIQDITEQKNSAQEHKRMLHDTIRTLAQVIETRDPYTSGHQKRVADLAIYIAKILKLPDEKLEALELACLVHDIGKIQIPSDILNRPSVLSDVERGMIQYHPELGYDILKGIETKLPIAEIVFEHHERSDGSGYPRGLAGDSIMVEAKILGIADVIESMLSHRPYRPALSKENVIEELTEGKGNKYDQKIVEVGLIFLKNYRVGQWVER